MNGYSAHEKKEREDKVADTWGADTWAALEDAFRGFPRCNNGYITGRTEGFFLYYLSYLSS